MHPHPGHSHTQLLDPPSGTQSLSHSQFPRQVSAYRYMHSPTKTPPPAHSFPDRHPPTKAATAMQNSRKRHSCCLLSERCPLELCSAHHAQLSMGTLLAFLGAMQTHAQSRRLKGYKFGFAPGPTSTCRDTHLTGNTLYTQHTQPLTTTRAHLLAPSHSSHSKPSPANQEITNEQSYRSKTTDTHPQLTRMHNSPRVTYMPRGTSDSTSPETKPESAGGLSLQIVARGLTWPRGCAHFPGPTHISLA